MTRNNAAKDIRQSLEFAFFMESIGWKVEVFNNRYIYLRKFPLIGRFAKCPRPDPSMSYDGFSSFLKKNKIFNFKISPNITSDSPFFEKEKKKLFRQQFSIDTSPFNPTVTIIIDLEKSEEEIFHTFSEAKRRGVRRALKNGLSVSHSSNIEEFIDIRQRQFFPLGFLVKGEMMRLWENFYPKCSDLLLAKTKSQEYVAGILLLYHNYIAYYWFASSLPLGKKLFAPTLLVWEAIKRAKEKGYRMLDFEGVYDDRFPKSTDSWRGFSKFKEGFSVNKVVYMENFYLKKNHFKFY